MGCSRARPQADAGVCHSSVPKERLRTNPHTTDRDPIPPLPAGQRLTIHASHIVPAPPEVAAGGLCPPDPPRFIAMVPVSESTNRNGTPRRGIPSPILAPESALGSRLRVALSSAQVIHDSTRQKIAVRSALRADRQKNFSTPIQTHLTDATLSGRGTAVARKYDQRRLHRRCNRRWGNRVLRLQRMFRRRAPFPSSACTTRQRRSCRKRSTT
jgi:hypothetical protein